MSLKLRLMLLSTLWLVVILVLFHIFVYFFVINLTTQSEVQLLWKKADTILQNAAVHDPLKWHDPSLLSEFLVSNELIRIVLPSGEVINQIYSNDQLLTDDIGYHGKYHSIIRNRLDKRNLYVQAPILRDGKQIGMLEIGRMMDLLDDYLDVLITALTVTSFGAVILSVIGGFFYTHFLFLPIKHFVRTMRTIEKSGAFSKVDERYMRHNDELGELGETFNRMIEKLEHTFVLQRQFVEDASHELRTPLTIIESYANLLQRWAGADAGLREEAIEAIRSESSRLKQLIDSLMQLVDRPQSDPMQMKSFQICKLAILTAESISKSLGREIRFVTPHTKGKMEGDPNQIKQLIIILLDNAMKYSTGVIYMGIRDLPDHWQMIIIDRGVGIEQAKLPYLFERFYRTDNARTRHTGGAGLGLAIAKTIVDRHRGWIEIKSKKGRGTKMIVHLPKRSTD